MKAGDVITISKVEAFSVLKQICLQAEIVAGVDPYFDEHFYVPFVYSKVVSCRCRYVETCTQKEPLKVVPRQLC